MADEVLYCFINVNFDGVLWIIGLRFEDLGFGYFQCKSNPKPKASILKPFCNSNPQFLSLKTFLFTIQANDVSVSTIHNYMIYSGSSLGF